MTPQPNTTYLVQPDVTTPVDGASHAHVFQTDAEGHTVVAMLEKVNRGAGKSFGNFEKQWHDMLSEHPATKIEVDINLQYTGTSTVPDVVEVEYRIDGGPLARKDYSNG